MLSCRLAQLSSCCPIGCLSSFLSACHTHLAVQSMRTVFGSGPVWLSACQSVAHCILHLHESSGRPCERPRGWESRRLIFVRTWQRADLNRADERREGTDIKRLQDLSPTLWGQEQSHDGQRVLPLNWFWIPVNVFASSAQFVTHPTCWVSLWYAEICHDTTSKHPPPISCALHFDPDFSSRPSFGWLTEVSLGNFHSLIDSHLHTGSWASALCSGGISLVNQGSCDCCCVCRLNKQSLQGRLSSQSELCVIFYFRDQHSSCLKSPIWD